MSALIGLTASLSTETAQAQLTPCATGLFDGITWRESTVHIGDTVHFTINLTASGGQPPAGVCRLSQGTNWVVLPDGTVRIINANYSKGACPTALNILCPPDGAPCIGGLTTAFLDGVLWFEYGPIQPADNGRATLFTTPARPAFGPAYPGTPVTLFGSPGFISVAAVSDAPSFDCESGTIFRGKASAAGNQPLALVNPCISVTKDCVLNCPPNNAAAFGQRINFQGTVRNCGDVTLTNVTVVDQLPAGATAPSPIAFGTVQPGGTPFNGTLRANESVTYSGSYQPGGSGAALCGPFRDVITVSGTDATSIPRTVTASDDAVCTVCTAPCIDVVKDCIDTQVPAGTPIRYRFTVRNCGDVPLQNVVAVDDNATPTNPADDVTTQIGDLAIGATRTVEATFPTSLADCSVGRFIYTNTVRVTGANICNPAQTVSDSDDCVATIVCQPCIRITEEVVCVRPDTQCDAFTPNPNDQTNACGFRNESGTDCSAFCFKIVIEAVCIDGTPSPVPATGIQVTSKLNISGCNFPTTLQPGAMAMCIIPAVTLCTNFTDIVTVIANNVVPDADDTDSVSVVIKPIAVRCVSTFTSSFDMDNNPTDNCVTLPAAGPVTLTTTIFNDSDVALLVTVANLPPLVDCGDQVTPIVIAQPIPIPARGTHVITGCYLAECANVTFDITVRGQIDVNTPDRTCLCFYNRTGIPIQTDVNANDHCPVCVQCAPPVTCRTTGGGNLLPGFVDQSCIPVVTTIFPSAGVDHISHGGQLGAPFSQMDCGAILGNPCIRGQWEHVRHYQGSGNPRDVVDMNFHSTTPKGVFDSLSCACLGCCDPATGAFIPPSLGPLIHKFQVCNPDDHKICGPQPRPAPANALIFSGIGRITPTDDISGPRANRSEWVIFRIYIEDRSEPGNAHAGGAVEPADIYCFQAWKTGIKTTRKPDFTTISTAFRMALGEANCDFLRALETGGLPIGTLPSPTVNGLTADIQDCGPLYNGNRQIHPSTGATCDE
jgi:uncharacterized repeat protein (TIGR01451 family)